MGWEKAGKKRVVKKEGRRVIDGVSSRNIFLSDQAKKDQLYILNLSMHFPLSTSLPPGSSVRMATTFSGKNEGT